MERDSEIILNLTGDTSIICLIVDGQLILSEALGNPKKDDIIEKVVFGFSFLKVNRFKIIVPTNLVSKEEDGGGLVVSEIGGKYQKISSLDLNKLKLLAKKLNVSEIILFSNSDLITEENGIHICIEGSDSVLFVVKNNNKIVSLVNTGVNNIPALINKVFKAKIVDIHLTNKLDLTDEVLMALRESLHNLNKLNREDLEQLLPTLIFVRNTGGTAQEVSKTIINELPRHNYLNNGEKLDKSEIDLDLDLDSVGIDSDDDLDSTDDIDDDEVVGSKSNNNGKLYRNIIVAVFIVMIISILGYNYLKANKEESNTNSGENLDLIDTLNNNLSTTTSVLDKVFTISNTLGLSSSDFEMYSDENGVSLSFLQKDSEIIDKFTEATKDFCIREQDTYKFICKPVK